MKLSTVFPSDFIAAGDLDGRDVTLTIERVADKGTVRRKDGQLIDKPVMYFKERPQGWIFGPVSKKILQALIGNDMDKWPGKQITLHPTTTSISKKMAEQNGSVIRSINGKMATVDCIRVRQKVELVPVVGNDGSR